MKIKDLLSEIDIVKYIGQYIDLKEKNNEYVALCPFHKESTPSFTITPSTQLFYCFGCGCGGNVLTFIQKYHKCNFSSAISICKEYANITDEIKENRLNAAKIIEKYHAQNKIKTPKEHTFLDPDIMMQYEDNVEKLKVWEDEGISREILVKYQVKYDPFSNRIVFPIRDSIGRIISVKGRTLDNEWKKKGLRKYTYFQSIGDLDVLFGYYEHYQDFIKAKSIILFEGEKSVMIAESWGIKNTAAILTSHLNPFQIPILIKLGCTVIFALDKEIDIRQDGNIKKLSKYVNVEYIYDSKNLLSEKMSPVDRGIEVWNQLYKERRVLS